MELIAGIVKVIVTSLKAKTMMKILMKDLILLKITIVFSMRNSSLIQRPQQTQRLIKNIKPNQLRKSKITHLSKRRDHPKKSLIDQILQTPNTFRY